MATEDDRTGSELAELRAELARFVLKEAGAAVGERPDLALGAALREAVDAAVRESLDKALRNRRELDPAVFAERVLRLAEARAGAVAPSSAAMSYAGAAPASGWAQLMTAGGRRPLAVAIAAIVLLAAVFAAGWFGRGQLAPPAVPAAAAASAPANAGEADPDSAPGPQSPPPSAAASGQPAVLNGVELSSRPAAEAPAAARRRPAAGGRAR